MNKKDLERGNEIEYRICELEKMQKWLENVNRNISVIANGCAVSDTIKLSCDMRNVLLGMCIGEKTKLAKEFEEL